LFTLVLGLVAAMRVRSRTAKRAHSPELLHLQFFLRLAREERAEASFASTKTMAIRPARKVGSVGRKGVLGR
jgi:hypothetical protein